MAEQPTVRLAAAYARVSTEEQGENNSIPDQLHVCRAYAAAHGLTVVREYVDMESGLKASRSYIDKLIVDAKAHLFSVVIVKKIDRLARGPRAFYRIVEAFEAAGTEVRFAAEDYPEEVIPFLVAFGGLEAKMIKERTAAGRRAKARSGRVNPPPRTLYGYSYDRETQGYVINDEEALWVRQIFAWHLADLGASKISNLLSEQSVPSKMQAFLIRKLANLSDPAWVAVNKVSDPEAEAAKVRARLATHHGWHPLIVRDLLRNPAYCGEGYANRWATQGGKRVELPREEWIPITYPPIIDRQTFEAAQETTIRIRNYRELVRTDRQYMLRGILYCGECQKSFVITYAPFQHRLKDGTLKTYDRGTRGYKCRGMRYHRHLYDCRTPATVTAWPVEQAVWEQVRRGLQNPALLLAALSLESAEAENEASVLSRAIDRVEQRLAELDLQTQRVLRLYATGKWSERDLDLQRAVINEERHALTLELQDRRDQMQARVDHQDLLGRIHGFAHAVSVLPEHIKDMDEEAYRQATEIARLIVEKVMLDRSGGLVIQLAFGEAIPEETPETGEADSARSLLEPSTSKTRCW